MSCMHHMEAETTYHVLVRCDHAHILWELMRLVWVLPQNTQLVNTCKDWLLDVLANWNEDPRDRFIMLVWSIWSLRSNMAHGKEVHFPRISVEYLQSYMSSLRVSRRFSIEEIIKGKMIVDMGPPSTTKAAMPVLPLPPPSADQVAQSVDGAFSCVDGSPAAGTILRHDGSMIFAAYRYLFNSNDMLEAGIHALIQDMALALQHNEGLIIVQSNSS